MKRLVAFFVQGLIFLLPVALTFWLLGGAFLAIDSWAREQLRLPLPRGMGFLLAIALITLVGFMASHFVTRRILDAFERVLERLPVVKMLHGALKDLLSAFVGPERRFDRPVLVDLQPGGAVRALGFVTRDSLPQYGLPESVAVYFPQAYNFAGQLVVVPRAAITPIDAPSADVMTFIVSGGVSGKDKDKDKVPAIRPSPQ
jgi:uncharacterized membrane protein